MGVKKGKKIQKKKIVAVKGRFLSLDILKAVAIILMVLVHYIILFLKGHSNEDYLAHVINLSAHTCAPFFLIVAGVCLAISVERSKKKNWGQWAVAKKIVKRGLFLFIGGLAFFVFWNADILHHIGLCLIFSYFVLGWNWKVKVGISALILAISEWMQLNFNHFQMWARGGINYIYFDQIWTLKGLFYNNFLNGWFPFIPWFVFMLVGTIIGKCLIDAVNKDKEKRLIGQMIIISAVLFILSPLITIFYDNTRRHFPSLVGLILMFAIFILLLAIFYWLLDYKRASYKFKNRVLVLFRPLVYLGKHSLKIYVAHILIGLYILLPLGLGDRLGVYWVIAISLCVLVFYWVADSSWGLCRKYF